ncbi:MAG TPA: FAD-dependent oxidoreductase [Acidimicrobiales bacterium]|jgi:sarcosine oxidase subunit beta|nr:FAD-dependent oxidoreductase [Acidimicrobiales bacterium]MDP6241170.1 FAD-dependent oxidoreductase [Acidimicrobiales bacterium]MDP7124966.1 FAD-dependent oxidoreductase [Acidimicrobiales bacterium]MDP7352462.1 FAD-dependent oxidoreductase [Acidimicrobiales bacterium]MDP7507151.1 FAD-dependent oxidoreductase [Acidimicrobiales bacterium]
MPNPTDDPDDFDAVIIGAGVLGGAIAVELSRRGLHTLNVDKASAAGAGSTINSCAIVRFSYSTVPGVSLAWEAMHYWTDWAGYIGTTDELGLVDFHRCGMFNLVIEEGDHSSKVRALWQELGIPFEDWTLADLAERMPLLDHGRYGPPRRPDDPHFWDDADGTITGAIFTPDAGYVSDPQLSCHNLQRAAEASGGEFWFNAEVTSVDQADGRVGGVTLADGRSVVAPVVVNAAGPHSAVVNEMAGVFDSMGIKTRALRHEVHHVPAPQGFDFMADGMVGADDDTGFYFRPETGNNVLIGSVDPKCDDREFVDPDDYDTVLSQDQWEAQVLRANRRMPTLGIPHEKKGVVDLYDVSDDWLPIYDRTDLDGFYVAIGTSGNQYKNAGAVGQLMAELIEAVESGHDHDASPVVVSGRYTGWPIDVGFYSRNREVNPDSSMSVHG